MKLFNIFKRTNESKIKGAGATLYPNKIVICTINRIKNSYGINSSNVSVLDTNVDSLTLGQILREHLNQSRDNLNASTISDYKGFLKAAGFSNQHDHHKNALHLIIGERKGKISITPSINGGSIGKNRGFSETADHIVLDSNTSNEDLANNLRSAWDKCR